MSPEIRTINGLLRLHKYLFNNPKSNVTQIDRNIHSTKNISRTNKYIQFYLKIGVIRFENINGHKRYIIK